MSTIKIEIDRAHFHIIAHWVVGAASKDDTLPVLTGVQLQWGPAVDSPYDDGQVKRQLVVGATDRYRLRWYAADVINPDTVTDEGKAIVPAKLIQQAAKAMPAWSFARQYKSLVTIEIDTDAGTVSISDLSGVSVSGRTINGDFPRWTQLVPDAATCGEREATAIQYSADYLMSFCQDAKRTLGKGVAVRLSGLGAGKPTIVQAKGSGETLFGLLMPHR